MSVEEQIKEYISSQPEPKRSDMQELHLLMLKASPGCRLWFFDGVSNENKVVSNPTVGYGFHVIKYANGKTREFFQIDMSANTTGISIHIIGVKDKDYLKQTFGEKIGKASVTGYCIKFKTLKDVNLDVLEEVIRYGFEVQNEKDEPKK